MNILAIDTSSPICGVAILKDDKIIEEVNLKSVKMHSASLMPMVSQILSKNNMNLSEIDLISCSVGPGSFTGIRIGIASVKAMAEVHSIPIAAVTSLETLARIDEIHKTKVALIDAKNHQVYAGIFDEKYQLKCDLMADDISKVIDVIKQYDDIICIGDGAMAYKNEIKQELEIAQFSDKNEQRSGLVGKVGYQKYLDNELKNADTLIPMYLRRSQAERMRFEK